MSERSRDFGGLRGCLVGWLRGLLCGNLATNGSGRVLDNSLQHLAPASPQSPAAAPPHSCMQQRMQQTTITARFQHVTSTLPARYQHLLYIAFQTVKVSLTRSALGTHLGRQGVCCAQTNVPARLRYKHAHAHTEMTAHRDDRDAHGQGSPAV